LKIRLGQVITIPIKVNGPAVENVRVVFYVSTEMYLPLKKDDYDH